MYRGVENILIHNPYNLRSLDFGPHRNLMTSLFYTNLDDTFNMKGTCGI